LESNREISLKYQEEIQTIDAEFIKYIFELNYDYIVKIDVEGHEETVINELLKIKGFNKISTIFYEVNTKWTNRFLIEKLLKKEGFISFIQVGENYNHCDILATR
jgi:hypothetical protein